MPLVRWVERLLAVVGLVCVGWAAATWLTAYHFQREQSRALEATRSGAPAETALLRNAIDPSAPIGRLEIPRLNVSVVVMRGDDELTLRKAVGHLPDTPLPWNGGNA